MLLFPRQCPLHLPMFLLLLCCLMQLPMFLLLLFWLKRPLARFAGAKPGQGRICDEVTSGARARHSSWPPFTLTAVLLPRDGGPFVAGILILLVLVCSARKP